MELIHRIRTEVLGVTQAELARITGASQGTVSRWERGDMSPSLEHLKAIRDAAISRGIPWDDSFFFQDGPTEPPSI